METISADIARAFVDLNRAADDLPPKNPDGIIKSMTCYKKPIYIKGKEPDQSLRQILIERYYIPYHRKVKEIVSQNKELKLALDCHSMAAEPPPIAPDTPTKKRPLICLGNAHGKACDPDMVKKLAKCFCEAFELEEKDVTINQPFAGGYITRTYGNNPLPWVQVEMNRSLYLSSPWFDPITLHVDNHRLMELNDRFKKALELYFKIKVTPDGGK
jgi:formiminoglutamase